MELDAQLHLYRYRPLEGVSWIRLLQLQPSQNHGEPLKCNILHVDRYGIPGFDSNTFVNCWCAVSYTWGEPIFDHSLICDDTYALKITANVDRMLRRWRKPQKSLLLWIDAISLDQSNRTEIETQVQIMGDIYDQAPKVRVWLGDASQEEEHEIVKLFSFFEALSRIRNSSVNQITKVYKTIFSNTASGPMVRFFSQPWFQRRWVLQELSKSHGAMLYFGSQRISWARLSLVLNLLESSAHHWELKETDRYALKALKALKEPSSNIFELLWNFDQSQCADSRDRLFALYSMANNVQFQNPSAKALSSDTPITELKSEITAFVDYKSEWTAVYTRFANAAIDAGYLRLLLLHASMFGNLRRKHRDRKLPSWLPDWSQPRNISVDVGHAELETLVKRLESELERAEGEIRRHEPHLESPWISSNEGSVLNIRTKMIGQRVQVIPMPNPLEWQVLANIPELWSPDTYGKRKLEDNMLHLIWYGIRWLIDSRRLSTTLSQGLLQDYLDFAHEVDNLLDLGIPWKDNKTHPIGNSDDNASHGLGTCIQELLENHCVFQIAPRVARYALGIGPSSMKNGDLCMPLAMDTHKSGEGALGAVFGFRPPPGPLMAAMKTHPEKGYRFLGLCVFIWDEDLVGTLNTRRLEIE